MKCGKGRGMAKEKRETQTGKEEERKVNQSGEERRVSIQEGE